jgi:hypothetical protein
MRNCIIAYARMPLEVFSSSPTVSDCEIGPAEYPIWLNTMATPRLDRIDISRCTMKAVHMAGGLSAGQSASWAGHLGLPYVVDYPIDIGARAQLTIEAGTVVKLRTVPGSSSRTVIRVAGDGATLRAEGTADRPVVFTALRDDRYGGNTDGDPPKDQDPKRWEPSVGDWEGISFGPGASETECVMRNCIIRYSAKGIVQTGVNVPLDNCTVLPTLQP